MDDQDRFEAKIDKIGERINSIDVTLASQHEVLKNHIARTEALEKIVTPIQKRDNMAMGVIKFIGIVGILGTIVEAAYTAVSFVRK